MSQGHATRSTFTLARVTHFIASSFALNQAPTSKLVLRFRGSNHIDASINLVLKSALLRASRRTATSETEPAAILRDGAPQVGCTRLYNVANFEWSRVVQRGV